MADRFKILGQAVGTGSDLSLYIVPTPAEVRKGATQTLITSLIVCNQSGGGLTYDVRLRAVTGSDPTTKEYLVKDKSLVLNGTAVLSLGLVLPGDAEILVNGSASLSFNLLGIEIS